MASLIPEQYLEKPFCRIYFKERFGLPILSITAESFDLQSCSVSMDAKAVDTASITILAFPTTVDLALNGIHEGVTVYIEMGYSDTTTPIPPKLPTISKTLFIGKLDRPTIDHNNDGSIIMTLKAKSIIYGTNLVKTTREFLPLPRIVIIQQVLLSHIIDFPIQTVLFLSAATLESDIRQVKETDLTFLKRMADKWDCRIHESIIGGLVKSFYFVDNNEVGAKLIDVVQGIPLGYVMHWRTGVKNLSKIRFSGATAAKKGKFSFKITREPGSKKFKVEKKTVEVRVDEDTVATWVLDETKVASFIAERGFIAAGKFSLSAPDDEIRDNFYVKRSEETTTATKKAAPEMPGHGQLGHKAEFEMAQGDVNLAPNVSCYVGGDVMTRFKSTFVTTLEKVGLGRAYRPMKVIHKFDDSGYQTKGTLAR